MDNQAALQAQRDQNMERIRQQLMINEKLWERKKAEIEYNVANRPLLVELQSQHFCDKLNEIRQVENFVQVLWEAKLDPQDHLEPW